MGEDKHPIRNGIIVGTVLLVIAAVVELLGKGVSWIAARSWEGLTGELEIPGWLFATLMFLPVIIAILVLKFRRCQKQPSEPEASQQPEWHEYTEDEFEGVVYSWDYSPKADPEKLHPSCLNDGMRLVYHEAKHRLVCQKCGRVVPLEPGRTYKSHVAYIFRLI